MSAARHVIVHYHIFKNAGGSIDLCLREAFGNAWATYERDATTWTAETNIGADELRHHLAQHPAIRALTSSTARWPEPSDEALRVIPIVFLRHPIDRIASLYRHRRHAAQPNVTNMTFAQYVDWALQDCGGFLSRSFQTLFLSDDGHLMQEPKPTAVTDAHYSSAASRLERLPVFGLLDDLGESLRQLTNHLGSSSPGLVFRPHHVNWSGRSRSLDERLRDIERELGSTRYRRLAEANEADLDLYVRATSIFDRAASLRPPR